jgi:raffinose/stachyose/melibiose transport system substrate-binding protein
MKKATKFGALALATVVASSVVLASPSATAAGNCSSRTTVTMLGTIKVEIQDQFLAAVKDYNNSQKCYTIKSIPGATGQVTFLQQITPMYAAHNAPTITYTLQEIPNMADKVIGWNGSRLASLVSPNLLAAAKVGGKQVGIPSTAEAFGLLYNKAVLDKAGIDPSTIHTLSGLESAFTTLKSKGFNAIHFSDIWWSLGAHFMNEYFTHAASTHEGRLKVLDQMAAGTRDLTTDPAWKNYIATFDLLKKYSDAAPNTQDSEYDASISDLASGKTGFLFQGNWTEPNLLQDSPTTDFGIMPLPMTNNASDYGNDSISVGVPGYFMVDRVDSTAAQRNGAIDFLTWLYTSPAGQHHVADPAGQNGAGGMGFIPVYNGFTVQPATAMAKLIAKYVGANKTLDWMNTYFPAGGQNLYGASGQKYMANAIDANGYAKEIMAAWKGQPKTWRGASAN